MEDLFWTIAICCIGVLIFLQPYIHNKLRSRKWKSNVTYTRTTTDTIRPVEPADVEPAAEEPVVVPETTAELEDVLKWLTCQRPYYFTWSEPTLEDAKQYLIAYRLHRKAQLMLLAYLDSTDIKFVLYVNACGELHFITSNHKNVLYNWNLVDFHRLTEFTEFDFENYVKEVFPIPESLGSEYGTSYANVFAKFITELPVKPLPFPINLNRDVVEFETATPIELRDFDWYKERQQIVEKALQWCKGKWIYINYYRDYTNRWFYIELIIPNTDPTILNSNGFSFYGHYLGTDRSSGDTLPVDVVRTAYDVDTIAWVRNEIEHRHDSIKRHCDQHDLQGLADFLYPHRFTAYPQYTDAITEAMMAGLIEA